MGGAKDTQNLVVRPKGHLGLLCYKTQTSKVNHNALPHAKTTIESRVLLSKKNERFRWTRDNALRN